MFPFLKTKLFLFLLLLAVIGTFYYFGDTNKLIGSVMPKLKGTPLAPLAEKIETVNSEELTKNFQDGVQSAESEVFGLSERTVEVSKHAGNVLGSTIQPAPEENTTPIHEKAFEYGKYVYCKQVVADYEELNPSLKE